MEFLLSVTWIALGVYIFKRGFDNDSPIVAIGFLLVLFGICVAIVPYI